MQIERTLIDLGRLEAFDFSRHTMTEPQVLGLAVARTGKKVTPIALTFDGKSIGHFALPHTIDSAAEGSPLISPESSVCEVRQLERSAPST